MDSRRLLICAIPRPRLNVHKSEGQLCQEIYGGSDVDLYF